jgi:hypothetical protein
MLLDIGTTRLNKDLDSPHGFARIPGGPPADLRKYRGFRVYISGLMFFARVSK